ncbi:MAG: RNA 2',3'-cyclic phosphodiesterase [Gemmatimonadota bacterium]
MQTPGSQRLFLAIEFPSPLIAALDSAVEPLRALAPELAWVPLDKQHLTMKFLGDVRDAEVPRVIAMAESVARMHRPFEIQLNGIGAFPNFKRARVVWLGVEQEARLELLHHDLEVAGEAEGFEIEGRPFRPHLTVARVRVPLDRERTRLFARAARRVNFSASAVVSEIAVFESTLASRGARYRRIYAATLGGGR